MKIRLREHAKFQADKMAKIALAATPRVLLDLYALEPGQAQKVHTHDDAGQDLRGARGPRPLHASAAPRRRWRRARPSWRRRAPRTASSTIGRPAAAARARLAAASARVSRSRPRRVHGHLPGRRVLSRGRRADRATAAAPRRDGRVPRRSDVLRAAAVQLRAITTRRPQGRAAHGRPVRATPSTWWCRRDPARGWSSTSTRG